MVTLLMVMVAPSVAKMALAPLALVATEPSLNIYAAPAGDLLPELRDCAVVAILHRASADVNRQTFSVNRSFFINDEICAETPTLFINQF